MMSPMLSSGDTTSTFMTGSRRTGMASPSPCPGESARQLDASSEESTV